MIRPVVGLVIAAATLLQPFGGKVHRKTEEGNRAYDRADYERALLAYTEAQEEVPDSPELHYNLGNVLYRQDDFEEARKSFTRALLSNAPGLTAAAAYNLGNALYREERYDEAVEAYRRSLMEDPGDPDAKRNLELALRALEEQQQQQQQQQQEGEDGEQDPEQQEQEQQQQEQQQEGSSGEGEEEEKKKEEPRPQPDPSKQEQKERDKQSRPEPREGEGQMTREEASRLLDNLDEQEREAQRRRAMRQVQQETRRAEEDW